MRLLQKYQLSAIIVFLILLLPPYAYIGWHVWDQYHAKSRVLLTGTPGGIYVQLGSNIVNVLNPHLRKKLTMKESAGSVQNVESVDKGDAELAFAQDGLTSGGNVRGLLRLFRSPMHVVCRDNTYRGISEITNSTRVYIGKRGSGTEVVADVILSHYGITSYQRVFEQMGFNEAAEALLRAC